MRGLSCLLDRRLSIRSGGPTDNKSAIGQSVATNISPRNTSSNQSWLKQVFIGYLESLAVYKNIHLHARMLEYRFLGLLFSWREASDVKVSPGSIDWKRKIELRYDLCSWRALNRQIAWYNYTSYSWENLLLWSAFNSSIRSWRSATGIGGWSFMPVSSGKIDIWLDLPFTQLWKWRDSNVKGAS